MGSFLTAEEKERAELIAERRKALKKAGFEDVDAAVIARHLEVSLDEAQLLLKRGCPSFTARRILV